MPIPFPTPTTNVPILGQPIEVYGYSVAVLAFCKCSQGAPIQLVSQLTPAGLFSVPSSCPRCQRIYAVQGMQQDNRGMLQFSLSCNEPSAIKLD